jgi:hypothetical protein
MITTKISIQISGSTELNKNTRFALGSSLTKTAKLGQAASIKEIQSDFTIRTGWLNSPFGIKVQPATKDNLTAVIGTAADWLEKFVQQPAGAIYINPPQGRFLAVPLEGARRTKRGLIARSARPRAIIGKGDFIIITKHGERILYQRRGRGVRSQMIPMYLLIHEAKIREKDILFGPVTRAFEQNFTRILAEQTEIAFKTAK